MKEKVKENIMVSNTTNDLENALTATSTTATPQLATETKFMQQYRIAAAVHGGGDIVAIRAEGEP